MALSRSRYGSGNRVVPSVGELWHARAMDSRDTDAFQLARRQGGVISLDQSIGLGFTPHQVKYRVRRRIWIPIGRLGYQLTDPTGPVDRLRMATALLPSAVAGRRSAGALHRFPSINADRAHVLVHSRTTHVFPDVVVHRCHDLADHHVTISDGLRVTTPERTLVDLAIELRPRHLLWVTDRLIADGQVSLPGLERVAAEVGRRGRPGTRCIREVIESLDAGDVSPLEQRGRELLLQTDDIPSFVSEFPLPWAPHRRFDDAFPGHKLAIEWDSYRWHGQRDRFESDRRRDQEAIARGWRVLRFTWRDVTQRSNAVVDAVIAALSVASEETG